jgi:hypothetical protein
MPPQPPSLSPPRQIRLDLVSADRLWEKFPEATRTECRYLLSSLFREMFRPTGEEKHE